MQKKFIALLTFGLFTVSQSSLASAHGGHRHHWRHHLAHRHVHALPVAAADVPMGDASGLASWYRGRGGGLTAAHRTYPFGTRVRVTNRSNGRSVVVLINDRGPFIRGRVIDLNRASASAIGVKGVSPVVLQRL